MGASCNSNNQILLQLQLKSDLHLSYRIRINSNAYLWSEIDTHMHTHTTHLPNLTIGESYKDDHHSIYNKHFREGDSTRETKKQLWSLDGPQTRRWVSQLSSKSSWATINDGKALQQVTLCYTCLQIATVYSDTAVGYMLDTGTHVTGHRTSG